MSYTKGELVSSALDEIGFGEYEFDISTEMRMTGIRKLNSMIAEWTTRGINISFPISKVTESTPDEDSNIPDWAWTAVVTNLAIRIAPSYGKTVSPETRSTAKHAMDSIYSNFAKPKEMQLPSMPKGAGYKSTDSRYTSEPVVNVLERIDESFDPSGVPTDE